MTAWATSPTPAPWDVADDERVEALPLPRLNLQMLDQPLPEPDWLIEHRIVRRSLTVLGAKPGVGKSWVAMDLVTALCVGRPWLGNPIDGVARCLYVDQENGAELALERLRRLGARSHNLGDRLHYATASLALPASESVARLRATIEAHRPDLIIVDTLASVAPAAEKDTESSSAFLGAVWHHARDHGAAMLLLHHLRKGLQGAPRDDQLDAFRGSGHLTGAVDRAWLLDPITPGEPRFTMIEAKSRRGRRPPALRVHVVDDGEDTRLEVVGQVDAVESGYDTFLAAVLAYLRAKPLHEAATKELTHLPQAGSERTAKEWLARALATGVLHKPGYGRWGFAPDQLPVEEDTA